MAKTQTPQPKTKSKLSENAEHTLAELYPSTPRAMMERESKKRAKKMKQMIDDIAGRFTEEHGAATDYTAVLVNDRVGNTMFRGLDVVKVVPKPGFRSSEGFGRSVDVLIADTRSVLLSTDLSVAEVKTVVHGVRMKISATYTNYYTVAGGRIRQIPLENYIKDVSKNTAEALTKVQSRLPDSVALTIKRLESLVDSEFIRLKIETEIANYSHLEKIGAIAMRLRKEESELRTILETILGELIAKYERFGGDEKAILDHDLNEKRRVEGKLQFREIMVLLNECMTDFRDADNTKKAAFIAAISPYGSVKTIGDEYSYYNSFLRDHADLVKYWKNELKSTKRGRPRRNKIQKLPETE